MDKKTNNRILIIGVDKEIHNNIKDEFAEGECSFVTTLKGKDGLLKFRDSRFDIIILDEKLVDIKGIDLCQTIRLENHSTPIIYISYHDDEDKIIETLKYGANDYLVKPLSYKEIYYKIKNYLKLGGKSLINDTSNKVTIGNHIIDFKSFEVRDINNKKYRLTERQIKLLRLLVEKNNEVVSREEILEKIWGYDVYIKTRTIDNVILSLRKIFEKDQEPNTFFKSVRGVGYKLTI
jgi:two-component system alkaline phosphatase synthesis response regulator PhoP